MDRTWRRGVRQAGEGTALHSPAWGQGIITRRTVSGVCAEGQADRQGHHSLYPSQRPPAGDHGSPCGLCSKLTPAPCTCQLPSEEA